MEEERGATGIQVARLEETEEKEKCERVMTPGNSSIEENRNGKETAERSSSEDRGTLIEIKREHRTDGEETDRQLLDGKGIRPGTQMLATHRYKKNPDGPVGNELDLSEGETLVNSLLDEARRQRSLVAGREWKGTGGICASSLSYDHHRRDSPGRG